jgi:hypothetical protein
MCATDSGTLLKELGRQSEGADPRDAGLDTWALLMNMIGRSEIASRYSGGFDDLVGPPPCDGFRICGFVNV